MNIHDEVYDIISSKAMIDRGLLSPTARLSDLNVSSLDVVEIVFALEDKFGIQIPFNANSTKVEFDSIGDVVSAVERLIAEKGSAGF